MTDIKITIVQSDIIWEDIDGNLELFQAHLDCIEETDIIVLPEMFTTGFTMNVNDISMSQTDKSLAWMMNNAVKKGAVICGSLIVGEEGKFYNRFYWTNPDGTFGKYDKRHLFRMSAENQTFTGGNERIVFTVKGWRILPLICYDLRFPVWSRNRNDYDILIYVANWPATRSYPWRTLLKARAIENQAYVVGVNRIGTDGHGIGYSGDSMIVDPKGHNISHTKEDSVSVETINLSFKELINFRNKFPAYLDADDFTLML